MYKFKKSQVPKKFDMAFEKPTHKHPLHFLESNLNTTCKSPLQLEADRRGGSRIAGHLLWSSLWQWLTASTRGLLL